MKQGIRLRGYRIKLYRGNVPSITLPTIWAGTTPEKWEEVKEDESVTQAVLTRSGRRLATFKRG